MRATGCGRTFNIWWADKVRRLFLTAESLWAFLKNAVTSGNKLQSFRDLNSGLSDSAPYRIWKRFLQAQIAIRTALARLCEPPECMAVQHAQAGHQRTQQKAARLQHAVRQPIVAGRTLFGPYVERRQAKLIAFIDDASRVLCHGEFFFEENADSMVKAIRAAFYKRGVPEQLLVDNGSIYCCQEIMLICARVGCILRHTAVRDAAAKGKIERFFRRVRDQFLVRKLDLSSLEELNKQFTHWVEHEYNATEHSTLGMKPIDRFGVDLSRIRFLSPSESTDELFYAEAVRTVKKDNTFSFQSVRYETPVDLRGKKVELRYERHRQGTVVIYDKGRRLGVARPLDAVANGLRRRRDAT